LTLLHRLLRIVYMVTSQLPALTYSILGYILKMHYYLFMCVYICANKY